MKNISRNESEFQNSDSEQLVHLFNKFRGASFQNRIRGLNRLTEALTNETDAEIKDLIIKIKTCLLDKHIKLVVAEIRKKYAVKGRPNEKDFYRICEAERITVVNSLAEPAARTRST